MKVMQAAQHIHSNVEPNLRTIAALSPRSVGFTEMAAGPKDVTSLDAAADILGPLGYQICTKDNGGLHCHEVPIAFRGGKTYHVDEVTVTQISPDLPGDGLGNDRHMTTVRYHNSQTGALHARVQTHWNAGLQGPHGNMLTEGPAGARVKAAAVGSERMETALRELMFNEHRLLEVSGDFNWRMHDGDKDFHVWTHSPKAMFDRLGLTYVTSGLDWMAWSKALEQVGSEQVIQPGEDVKDAGRNGSDHPWILATLRLAKGSK